MSYELLKIHFVFLKSFKNKPDCQYVTDCTIGLSGEFITARKFAKVMFLQVSVILSTEGGCAWLLRGGGVHAWLLRGGTCVVAPGGACMVAPGGGACVVAPRGACVVAPRGACVVAWGGMRGCMRGFSNEIRSMSGRYASYWNAFCCGESLQEFSFNKYMLNAWFMPFTAFFNVIKICTLTVRTVITSMSWTTQYLPGLSAIPCSCIWYTGIFVVQYFWYCEHTTHADCVSKYTTFTE